MLNVYKGAVNTLLNQSLSRIRLDKCFDSLAKRLFATLTAPSTRLGVSFVTSLITLVMDPPHYGSVSTSIAHVQIEQCVL